MIEGRQHHHPGRGQLRGNFAGGDDPAGARHLQVHHHDIRPGGQGFFDGFEAVRRLAHDFDIGFGRQHHRQPAPDQRLIVHDQQPQDGVVSVALSHAHSLGFEDGEAGGRTAYCAYCCDGLALFRQACNSPTKREGKRAVKKFNMALTAKAACAGGN